MKNPILILCFIACTSAVYAQKPRVETLGDRRNETYFYQKGGDSVRFSIVGKNDTVQKAYFYRNGKVEFMIWKKDSSYYFDALGRLATIIYHLNEDEPENYDRINFFANGQKQFVRTTENNICSEKTYTQDGHLVTQKSIKSTVDYHYFCFSDRNSVPINVQKVDTLRHGGDLHVISYDTSFYDNGKPFEIEIFDHERGNIYHNWYNKDGSLLKSLPPDSLDVVIFKDNVDCYYGLKNKRGDTVVKPRFERITKFKNDFFAAYTGETAVLFHTNGAPIATSFNYLTNIKSINALLPYEKDTWNYDYRDKKERANKTTLPVNLYSFTDERKYGIMTDDGKILIPPQYLKLQDNYTSDTAFFQYNQYHNDSLIKTGFVSRQGKTIFPDYIKGVFYAYREDYFFLSLPAFIKHQEFEKSESKYEHQLIDERYLKKGSTQNVFGLGRSDGTILLAPKFNKLHHIDASFFIVSVVKGKDNKKDYICRTGIFNAQTKKMILDTTDFIIDDKYHYDFPYFAVQHALTQKYGIIDTSGRFILPISYDSLAIVDAEKGLFWIRKGKNYQIARIEQEKIHIHTPIYDFLYPIMFDVAYINSQERLFYFLAKHKNKWGLIDADEKVVKPFEYDYAAISSNTSEDFYLVKNNQMTRYDDRSLPNETPLDSIENKIEPYQLLDKPSRIFFVNKTGKVVIPPQYENMSDEDNETYALVQDDKERKKLIFFETNQVIDFPFDYEIEIAEPKSRVIIVKGAGEVAYGAVSTDKKVLVPCNNYSVALADIETSTFFVKSDTPILKRFLNPKGQPYRRNINGDTLSLEDSNWWMYDGFGKKVGSQPFRFPINFEQGIGIGMQDKGFNLYKTNGEILLPFVKNNLKNGQNTEGGYFSKNKAHKK